MKFLRLFLAVGFTGLLIHPAFALVINYSDRTIYAQHDRLEEPVTVPPGWIYDGDIDGIAVPQFYPGEIFKTIPGANVLVGKDGYVTIIDVNKDKFRADLEKWLSGHKIPEIIAGLFAREWIIPVVQEGVGGWIPESKRVDGLGRKLGSNWDSLYKKSHLFETEHDPMKVIEEALPGELRQVLPQQEEIAPPEEIRQVIPQQEVVAPPEEIRQVTPELRPYTPPKAHKTPEQGTQPQTQDSTDRTKTEDNKTRAETATQQSEQNLKSQKREEKKAKPVKRTKGPPPIDPLPSPKKKKVGSPKNPKIGRPADPDEEVPTVGPGSEPQRVVASRPIFPPDPVVDPPKDGTQGPGNEPQGQVPGRPSLPPDPVVDPPKDGTQGPGNEPQDGVGGRPDIPHDPTLDPPKDDPIRGIGTISPRIPDPPDPVATPGGGIGF